MIEEKRKRSKTYRNMEVGACAKSVKFPIVLLQRLRIGAKGDILAKETILKKGETTQAASSKKHKLRNSSSTVLNSKSGNTKKDKLRTKQTSDSSSNDQAALQGTNATETTTITQSTVTDTANGIALSTSNSYKFKKKLKRLQTLQLNEQIKTRSGNKLNDKKSVITNENLSEKITEDSKLLADVTAEQKTEISSAIAAGKKLSGRRKRDETENVTGQNNSDQHNLITDSCEGQETSVIINPNLLNGTSTTKETIQAKISVSTRSKLLKETEVDNHEESNVDNSVQNHSMSISCPAAIRNSASMEVSEKVIPVNEETDPTRHDNVKNSIRTRSKMNETDNRESPVPKSTPKKLKNKPLLKKKVLECDNSNIEPPISNESSDVDKPNDNKLNLPERARNKLLEKQKIDDENSTQQSTVGNGNTNLVQTSLTSNSSHIPIDSNPSSGELPTEASIDTDSIIIEDNKIVENKITTRSKLLEKNIVDGSGNVTIESKVTQPETNNSTTILSEVQNDSKSLIVENLPDQSTNLTDSNKKKIAEVKKISTRSKTFDKNNTAELKKNVIENGSLQSKKAQPVTIEKKSLPSRKSSDISKITAGSLETTDSGTKNVISTRRSRLLEKTKIDDKQVTEEASIDVAAEQSKENQSVSTSNEIQINNRTSSSEKSLDTPKSRSIRTPKKVDTRSTVSTRSKADKDKIDNSEKTVQNDETVRLEQNHSLPESEPMETNEAPVPDSLKLSTDVPNTKENTLTRSKSLEKKGKTDHEKSDMKNEIAQTKQTEVQINSKSPPIETPVESQNQSPVDTLDIDNTISTRCEILEKNETVEHGSDNASHLETNNSTSNSSEISKIPLESEKLPCSPKRNTAKTPKKIVVRSAISTRSKLIDKNESENREDSIVGNGENINSISNSPQVQSNNETTVDTGDSPREPAVKVDVLGNTMSTRSGSIKKTRADVPSKGRKKKALVENHHSPSKSQTNNELIAQQIADISLGNEGKNCNLNIQQRVCSKKEIIIKLFRCDQVQSVDRRLVEKEAVEKKTLRGKRKKEHESTVEEIPKAKKSKQVNPSNSGTDLPALIENQESIVESQLSLGTTENIDKSVIESQTNMDTNIENQQPVADNQEPQKTIEDIGEPVTESQSNAESNLSDINNTKSIKNVSESRGATEKDSVLDNLSDINIVENASSAIEIPEIEEIENQCGNERVENQKGIIVNISGANTSAHEEETLGNGDDRDEAIAIDSSESETNAVNNDEVINENSTSAAVIRDKETQSLLARRMVEEVINDWTVADDDKTDNTQSPAVNENISTPEVIQIDDNDDLDVIIDVRQEAVSTERGNDPSHNLIPAPRESAELSIIDISDGPQIETETSTYGNGQKSGENTECNNMERETRESNSTSEMSEAEDVDDSNFESIDESSCAEIFPNENGSDHDNNVPQETITYYNSEDISIDVGASPNSNRMNDVVMNLKDACDKITADLSGVNETNDEPSNRHEPELLFISDDSDNAEEEEEEEGEEVMIIEPLIEIHQAPSPVDEEPESQQSLLISNQLRQVMQQGTPSISVIKASELRDEVLEPPVEYPIKPTGQQVVVYPQRQMLSTTLLPASIISGKPDSDSSVFTEESIIQCPKCRCDFVGKSRLRRHWLTCGDEMYLNCPCCTTRVKQRRSLINHINTQHPDRINRRDVVKAVENIVKQTRDAAGVKLKQGSQITLPDLLPINSASPIIELPAYIRIQCVVCNKTYDEVPATYKKTCDDCSSDLMTAICQLCRKQYMLSSKVALHVQGNCIFSGRIKCQECDFVGSSRYYLQEHIIRRHIYVAPEDYVTCSLGCGKKFRVHDALRKHERICRKDANLTCRFCDYKTKHRSAMKMHVQQHIVHERLTVDDDGNVQLFARERRENGDRDLTTEQQVRSVIRVHCSRCNRTRRLTNNRSSCETCHLSFAFSCSRCPNLMSYDSLHGVRLHVIRQHCVKIHECPHCADKFSYVYDLTRHASKCKAKSLKCEQCSFATNAEYKLRQHRRRVHMTESGEPPMCKKCGKWFKRGDSLRRHETNNCGVEPSMSCEHCQFRTKTKFSLLRHIQSQHAYIYDNFNFVCDRCNKFYTNMYAYEEHVKNCHALFKN